MMTFGQVLRQARLARQLTQRELAARVEVDFTYISKLENDRLPPPSARTMKRLAVTLRVEWATLTSASGTVPRGLRDRMRQSPLLIELVEALADQSFPDELYRRMLALLGRASGEGTQGSPTAHADGDGDGQGGAP